MERPKNISEYLKWAKDNLDSDFEDSGFKRRYDVNLTTSMTTVSKHKFFLETQTNLENWNQEYSQKTGTMLLMGTQPLQLIQKPYQSAVDKSFRINVLWNDNFPEAPKQGWVTTENIYHYFNDLIL